jgi:hypothetical protein
LRHLRLDLAVGAHLLALDLPVLRRPDAGFANLANGLARLRLLDAVGANLLTLDTSRTLRGDAGLPLHPRWTGLTALRPHLDLLRPRRTRLLTLGAHLDTLHALRPFGPRLLAGLSLLALSPRLLARLRLLTFGARGLPVLVRPRTGRGADRQSGDAGGE